MDIRELKYGDYTAKINVTRGANCISLVNRRYGAHILREPDYRNPDNPYLYGMPILFPVNRISGGTFTFDGREYRLPVTEPATGCCLHGDLHSLPFLVEKECENEIVCARRSHGAYMGFPHDFSVRITYVLTDTGLMQKTEVTNHSAENMPNLLGFHTTFKLPFIADTAPGGIVVRVAVSDYVERNMENYLPTGKILPPDAVSEQLCNGTFDPCSVPLSRHYRAGEDGAITLWDKTHGVEVCYENDAKFAWRLIYNGDAKEFICLEPQNCAVNCPNAAYTAGFAPVPYIAPGATEVYTSRIYCHEKGETV
ncbi:MAG: aldose 1-epimerase [Clostridia bacterium]|nr:aldose 1-epimerase [Clostridia bacterium]